MLNSIIEESLSIQKDIYIRNRLFLLGNTDVGDRVEYSDISGGVLTIDIECQKGVIIEYLGTNLKVLFDNVVGSKREWVLPAIEFKPLEEKPKKNGKRRMVSKYGIDYVIPMSEFLHEVNNKFGVIYGYSYYIDHEGFIYDGEFVDYHNIDTNFLGVVWFETKDRVDKWLNFQF